MNLPEMINDISSLMGVDITWKQAKDSPLKNVIGDMTHRSEFCNKIKSKKVALSKCVYDCSEAIHYLNKEEILIRKTCHAGGQLICARIFSEGHYLGSLLMGPYTDIKENATLGLPYFEAKNMNKIFSIVAEITPLIIEKIKTKIKIESSPQRNPKIDQMISYMKKNFNRNITIDHLSLECHLSGFRLMHLFKNEVKQTIFQYLMDLRIKKACELLNSTTLKVNKIASLVGFQNSNFFNSKFKLKCKMTPLEYRRKHYIAPNP